MTETTCGHQPHSAMGLCNKCYQQLPRIQERQRLYRQRPEVRARKKAREHRPDVVEQRWLHNQQPEVRARVRAYSKLPEVKERTKARRERSDVKAHWREYSKTYDGRPENRARRNARQRKFNRTRKLRAMELLGGAVCPNCGCDDVDFLEINHKRGRRKADHHGQTMLRAIIKGTVNRKELDVACRLCNALHFLRTKNPEAAKRFEVLWKKGGR